MKTSFDGYASFIILDLISNCPYFLFVFIERKAFHKSLQQKRAEVRKGKNLITVYIFMVNVIMHFYERFVNTVCTFLERIFCETPHFCNFIIKGSRRFSRWEPHLFSLDVVL